MFAVVRIHGRMHVDSRIQDTLKMMRLNAANQCVVLPETPDVKGMLHKAKEEITWGEISKETLTKMLEKRLRAEGAEKKVDKRILKDVTGFDSFDSFAGAIIEEKVKLHHQENLQPTFRLTPPSKGLKSIRDNYPRGDLGYRGKEINELILRMI